MIKIYFKHTLLLLSLICFFGCQSYKTGSLMHPQLKTVNIAQIKNTTDTPRLQGIIRQKLLETFMFDGSLKLVDKKNADLFLFCNVEKYQITGLGTTYRSDYKEDDDGDDYGTEVFALTVDLAYKVFLPGKEKPLLTGVVTGQSDFNMHGDLEISRQKAFKQACSDAASKIVSQITEAW
ncbi:MAG: LPS assembly lipoprotein LptE [Verrucomicrobiota bacterium]|nr:LPS assembly lipoprotein LptE [Verrucomicrobiota bacterium]